MRRALTKAHERGYSEDDVKQAYHRRAESLHPDRGGDIRRFLLLQQHLEQSLYLLRQRERQS